MRPVTQAELEQLLKFPRAYLRTRLPAPSACPHATNFDASDPGCVNCTHRDDCAWLAANDECGNLNLGSVAQVSRALEDMCARAQAAVAVYRHRACSCPTCTWLHQAKKTLKRIKAAGISVKMAH